MAPTPRNSQYHGQTTICSNPDFTDTRVGLSKGYAVTAIARTPKPSHRKGKSTEKKQKFVKSVIREVVGFAPYERRVLELLRNGKVGHEWIRVSNMFTFRPL
jgi:large subunit ribosomal protein L36e